MSRQKHSTLTISDENNNLEQNLNLLNNESHEITGKFFDSMLSFMLTPLISKPTRITANSATLIDNIFTNDSTHYLKCGLLFTDIYDHFPVFAISDETNRIKFSDQLVRSV